MPSKIFLLFSVQRLQKLAADIINQVFLMVLSIFRGLQLTYASLGF